MEPRLRSLEEVQSEAGGVEAEEEELWVRRCAAFPVNLPVAKNPESASDFGPVPEVGQFSSS